MLGLTFLDQLSCKTNCCLSVSPQQADISPNDSTLSLVRADHAENQPCTITGQSISASLISREGEKKEKVQNEGRNTADKHHIKYCEVSRDFFIYLFLSH